METRVQNLIILDKSGSMSSITSLAVAGVNETIGSIRAIEKKHPEQHQFVTLIAFCDCSQQYIFDNIPVAECRFITEDDYRPCCCTPLYDAIGNACIRMEKHIRDLENTAVSVTIITDGYENASKEFNHLSIVKLISRLKENGWLFAYIGADHDVESVAFSLQIDHSLSFCKDTEGVKAMFAKEQDARSRWNENISMCCSMESPSSFKEAVTKASKASYFNKD